MTHVEPEDFEEYGDAVPFADPPWYQGWKTPYYRETHAIWRAKVREFTEREIVPNVAQWEEAKSLPKSLVKTMANEGLLPATVGSEWPSEWTDKEAPEGYDAYHAFIYVDELSRCASGGVVWGVVGGMGIGLPPVIHFGDEFQQGLCCRQVLNGDAGICLAITEPQGGSDVANLHTSAVLDDSGKNYIVNGEKKWITNGVTADWFTTAVRTGKPGMGGVSVLLIPRSEGVETRQMQCMGVYSSGTTYVTFDDVVVPVENRIGAENKGFMIIMNNFNQERLAICIQANRFSRVCMEESWLYAHKRKTFGKRLIDHPVIRWKFAEMARQVDCLHCMLEYIAYQGVHMDFQEAQLRIGGTTALLKVQATKTLEYCAREAAQIFGGSSYVRGGQGEKIERIYREVRAFAIPGGSEEVMLDLGIRQSMKLYEMMRANM
jgi:alkylation response protein AidB-like acyl-CoA dehydrogenase